MPAFRTTLAALAFAGLALTGAPAQAQQSRESVKADVTAWGQAITSAFTPGYWEGQMQELDANGAVVNTEERPDCIKQGEYGKLGSSLSEMFMTIADMADCTTTSGGSGSLNLRMECQAGGNKHMVFVSAETYGGDQVNWTVDFKADGEGAPEARSMRMTARKTKATCS